MSLYGLFDDTITVRRLKDQGGSYSSFQATATVDCTIQALGAEARQVIGILDEKAWRAWLREDSTIAEGDRITDQNGKVYEVREVVTKDYGINRHKEVLLEELNA